MGSRLNIALLISFLVHGAAYAGFRSLKVRKKKREKEREVFEQKKKPRPPKKVKIKPVSRPPTRALAPRPRPRAESLPTRVRPRAARRIARPRPTPPPPRPPDPSIKPKVIDLTAKPVGGLSGRSFCGDGPAMPAGNTTLADPDRPRPRVIPRRAWSKQVPRETPPAPPPPRPRPRPRRKKVVTVKVWPKPVRVPRLGYPEKARRRGIEGTVKLEVTVGKDGKVTRVRVIKGIGYGLDEVAVRALKRAKFKPAIGSDGKPMVYTIRYKYTFRLDR